MARIQNDRLTFDQLRRSSRDFDVIAQALYVSITAANFDTVKLLVNLALKKQGEEDGAA